MSYILVFPKQDHCPHVIQWVYLNTITVIMGSIETTEAIKILLGFMMKMNQITVI